MCIKFIISCSFLLSLNVFASEKCFLLLPFETSEPTQPQEKICIGENDKRTGRTKIRLMWGNDEIALFNNVDVSFQPPTSNKTEHIFSASGYFTPAINAFAINMSGTIDPQTKIEKGNIQIGNQIQGRQNLYYKSE